MTRYERKLFFERLLTMRATYRAQTHVSTGLTIDQAMTVAAQRFNAASAADLEAAAEPSRKANPAAS